MSEELLKDTTLNKWKRAPNTQEDIEEWMRACNKLQVCLRELEDGIKAKDKQLTIYKRALELACERLQGRDFAEITHPKFYIDRAKKELEEQYAKD